MEENQPMQKKIKPHTSSQKYSQLQEKVYLGVRHPLDPTENSLKVETQHQKHNKRHLTNQRKTVAVEKPNER